MKRIKKIASIILAMAMVFAMGITAFATEVPKTYSITINNEAEGHTYEAYQILAGTLAEDEGKLVLSDIDWGTGITDAGKTALGNGTTQKDAAAYAETLENIGSNSQDAADLAQILGQYLATATGTTNKQTDGKYVISGLAPGYYLVKDKDGSLSGNDNYTTFILEVVGEAIVEPKNTGTPTPDKQVKDKNDTTGDVSEWQSSADYDIGDTIDYLLKATLPSTINSYDTYKLIFHDELSTGLDYVENSVVVKKGESIIDEDAYTITYEDHKLTVTFNDVKKEPVSAVNGDVITVEYKATLNEQAKVGAEGNLNTLTLEYSNNPNSTGDGDNDSTGTTPPKTAVVFTFQTIVNKVDENNESLEGAEFTLSKLIKGEEGEDDTWKVIKTINGVTTFTFNGLDDGRYKLEESKTPDGYNTIDPVYFTIEATHDAGKGVGSTTEGEQGALTELNVYATDEQGKKLTGDNVTKFTVAISAGSATTDIMNMKGSILPSTGGIGTTIFYVVGGILVIGAGILLVTKRRMKAQ